MATSEISGSGEVSERNSGSLKISKKFQLASDLVKLFGFPAERALAHEGDLGGKELQLGRDGVEPFLEGNDDGDKLRSLLYDEIKGREGRSSGEWVFI